jgi:GH15 family glucan-1,4-alpha-glucosidase
MRIEDYALIGDLHTAALVSRGGSIDWLCLPRFDSAACFTALLGDEKHGRWLLAPAGEVRNVTRRYRDGTLVLETDFETDDGAVRVVDCMPIRTGAPVVVRLVEGLRGTVKMRTELVARFDYGSTVPWVEQAVEGLTLLAGPNALYFRTPIETRARTSRPWASFRSARGRGCHSPSRGASRTSRGRWRSIRCSARRRTCRERSSPGHPSRASARRRSRA